MTVIDQLKENRAAQLAVIKEERSGLGRLTASEARVAKANITTGEANVAALDGRIAEFQEAEAREARAASVRAIPAGVSSIYASAEEVYRPDREHSFFRDLRASRVGDWGAAERLERNNKLRGAGAESRALSTTTSAGGDFAPPLWLVEEFINLARPGRVTADLLNLQPLETGISSVNLPKVASGTTTAVQATQNTGVSNTDLVSTAVSSGITTVAGQQVVSLQLLSQSGVAFDRVILADLAADHAKSLDTQVIAGTGATGQLRGILSGAGLGVTTYTSATPKVVDASTPANSFYNAVIRAINTINTTRYLPATHIVMHPRRWASILQALDSASRPLVLSAGGAFNALGTSTGVGTSEGHAGELLNLPVCIDPNIPTNLGAGTNEDRVFVLRASDLHLWESPMEMSSFDAPYAASLAVLFRCHSFSALIPDRYSTSTQVISGTGLVAPAL